MTVKVEASVALSAFPVTAPVTFPVTLPVTLPVRFALTLVRVKFPVFGL